MLSRGLLQAEVFEWIPTNGFWIIVFFFWGMGHGHKHPLLFLVSLGFSEKKRFLNNLLGSLFEHGWRLVCTDFLETEPL